MAYEPDHYKCRKCGRNEYAIYDDGCKQKPKDWSLITLEMMPICHGYLCPGCTQQVLHFVFR